MFILKLKLNSMTSFYIKRWYKKNEEEGQMGNVNLEHICFKYIYKFNTEFKLRNCIQRGSDG